MEDLHAVEQRWWEAVKCVGGGDKQHLRQIEWHAQVVVDKAVVLGRVEHLEERRRGISAPVGADFINLVQHEDGVTRFGASDALDDPSWHGADIGTPVSTDLGLVSHSTQ